MPENTRTLKINSTTGTIVDVPCAECKRSTKHKVLTCVEIQEEYWAMDGSNSTRYWIDYQIVECQGCESITFRQSSINTEDVDYYEDGHPYVESIDLYPNRNEGRTTLKDSHLLPSNIQRIYEETIKALNNDQQVLAGIGLRAVIETICKDKQAIGSNLKEKIDSLVDLGVLTLEGAIILHKVRTLGNDAAHEVKPHTSEQLDLALDVAEHLLQGVYILPYFAEQTFK